jgi:predicted aspartyl protease
MIYSVTVEIMIIRSFIYIMLIFLLGTCSKEIGRDYGKPKQLDYATIWDQIRNLDFEIKDEFQTNDEHRSFINILNSILNADYLSAKKSISDIYFQTTDSTMKHYSNQVLTDLLFFESNWNEILMNYQFHTKDLKDEDNIMVSVEAYSKADKEEYIWAADSFKVHTIQSVSGAPIIEVIVNGNSFWFWVDTGANYSVLASDAADIANIIPLTFERAKALTATVMKVNYLPAIIDELKIGELTVKNHPTIILNDFDLRFRIFGSNRLTKIDGIVGWKLLQNLDITLNYSNNNTIIRRPIKRDSVINNFFWLGIPVLRVQSTTGRELFFGLDTGMEKSIITENILEKMYFDNVYWVTREEISAGGAVYNFANVVPQLDIIIDGKPIRIEDVGTGAKMKDYFVRIDGIIGSDVLLNSEIRIDCTNGYFSYEISE